MLSVNRMLFKVGLAIAVLSAGSVSLVEAGLKVWTSSGPEGGRISGLAIDPQTPSILYAGTQGGGVFKSTDGGDSWSAVNSGLTDYYVHALAIDPLTPSTLYAGTEGGMFKSTDSGGSWSAVLLMRTYALAIDPLSPTTVYAAGGGVLKSTDGGAHWSSASPIPSPHVAATFAMAIDPEAPNTLYAATYGIGEGGLFKSTDGGGSWIAVNSGLTSHTVHALAIDPQTPSTLYAATYSGGSYCSASAGSTCGVFKSIDGGQTWSPVLIAHSHVRALAIDPQTASTLYAGTEGSGVFKSTDGGASWTAVNSGLTDYYAHALTIDPLTPSTLYAGTQGTSAATGGVFKSTDGGVSWSAANAGLTNTFVKTLAIDPLTPSTLYAGTEGGMFKSTDGGGSWTAVNAGLTSYTVHALAIDPQTPSTLYAAAYGIGGYGVFKSTDEGGNWSAVRTTQTSVLALAIDPLTPGTLYAGGSGVFKSKDAGASWSAANAGLTSESVRTLAIDPLTPSTLYAGGRSASYVGRGVFKSTNGGASWSPVNSGLINPVDPPNAYFFVNALVIDPVTPTTLYAGTSGSSPFGSGVFKSTDGGGSWTAANAGLTSEVVQALAIDPLTPRTLYAGTFGSGVFKSTDGGSGWTAVNAGLTNTAVSALVIDPLSPTTVYAGTAGSGVFQHLVPFTATLNQGTFQAGDTLVLTAIIAPDPTLPPFVDVYVVLQLTDGSFLSLRPGGGIAAGITPLASGVPWPTMPLRAEVFRYTLIGGEPLGSYRWLAGLVQTGTGNLVSAISEALFNIDTTVPVLITPIGNAAIRQNDPTIGCPSNPTRGFGSSIFFDWTESSSPNGIAGYQIFAKHRDAPFPIVNVFVAGSQFVDRSCNSFVGDESLNNWDWRVRAQDKLGNFNQWSETATFRFEPCRLSNGAPCFVP